MSLHVGVSGWLLGGPSGANRRLLGLLQAIAPQLQPDERITVLHRTDYTPPWHAPGIAWRPVPIRAGPSWRRVVGERRHLPRLVDALALDVLDHGFLPAPKVGCALCLLVHDVRDADGEGRRPRWLGRWLLRRAARRATAIVVPSRFTATRLRAHVACPPPIHVIGNPAVLPRGTPPPDAGYLLHVGHLEPRKNLALLLRALALLPEARRPQLRLVGADAGSGLQLRRLAAGLEVEAHVEFLGTVRDEALPDLYAGASAVLLPSRYEGFGLCALEGLAAGRPVLVAATSALVEFPGTVQLPIDDPVAWSQAIAATTTPTAAVGLPTAATLAAQQLSVWRQVGANITAHPAPT